LIDDVLCVAKHFLRDVNHSNRKICDRITRIDAIIASREKNSSKIYTTRRIAVRTLPNLVMVRWRVVHQNLDSLILSSLLCSIRRFSMKWQLAAICAFALIPSLAAAQQRDTIQSSSEGTLAQPSRNYGLSTDQVKQLQKAINSNGCTVGQVNGTIDAQTMAGIACIRRTKNITSQNFNDVLRALRLDFTAPDSLGTGTSRDSTMWHHDTSGTKSDSAKAPPRP
jgi:hypothetical protein